MVAWLTDRLGLRPGATVVDVGAGTGKLTRDLVPTGARVVAVEPLAEMLEQLAAAVPEAEALAGSAEELPLEDSSADAVVAASAFHWFEPDRALPEIHRVLRPGGALATIGNGRDLSDPLQQEIEAIVGPYLPAPGALRGWLAILEREPAVRSDRSSSRRRTSSGSTPTASPSGWPRSRTSRGFRRTSGRRCWRSFARSVEAQPESPFPFRYRTAARVCRRT